MLWLQSGLYLLYVTQRVLPLGTSPMRQQWCISRISVKLVQASENPQAVCESQTRALCAVMCWSEAYGCCHES